MDEVVDIIDVLHLSDLLERVWQERGIVGSSVERQSWDVVESMVLNATSVEALASKLRECIRHAARGGYRRVLRLALTHVEETILNCPACVGL